MVKLSGLQRHANDFYPTRDSSILVGILNQCIDTAGKLILDPCCGDGEILRHYPSTLGMDIRPYPGYTPTHIRDATSRASYDALEYDWAITNPPFSLAMPILQQSFDRALIGCAFLLRLSFLEPTKDRAPWLIRHQKYMSHQIILNPRPTMRSDTRKSDSVTLVWLVWDKRHKGGTNVIYAHGWR